MIQIKTPYGWNRKKLSEIARIDRKNIKPESIKPGTFYIGLEHINKDGSFGDFQAINPGELSSNKFYFEKNHILYGKLRPYLKKIARPEISGICSTDIIPILPTLDIDRDFLFYYLRQPKCIDLATVRSSGANLPRISPKTLGDFPIVFPPIAEQKRIAAILDKADAVRRKRREAIRLTEELLRSVFLDMFGDPVTNPKGWDVVDLKSIASKPQYGDKSCRACGKSVR
jgi:type I restriction enzyme S subunit